MLACWTRKEAYGKVLGVGIRYTMNQAPLFLELHRDQWTACVAGLFGNEQHEIQQVSGIQLELPFPAVASLMYAVDDQDKSNVPQLSAYQLSNRK